MLIFYCPPRSTPPPAFAGQINCYSYFKTLSKDFSRCLPLPLWVPTSQGLAPDWFKSLITLLVVCGAIWQLAWELQQALGVLVTHSCPPWVLWHLAQWLMCSGGSVHICEINCKGGKAYFSNSTAPYRGPLSTFFFTLSPALGTPYPYTAHCRNLPGSTIIATAQASNFSLSSPPNLTSLASQPSALDLR